MLGVVLKQLFAALKQYTRYHLARLLHINPSVRVDRAAVVEPRKPEKPKRLKLRGLDDPGLDDYYLTKVKWPTYRTDVLPTNLSENSLYQLWRTPEGGQKWSQYFAIYQEVFRDFHLRPVRLLEIGVFRGASLRMWKNYFSHPETQVVGIDINKECSAFDAPLEGRHIRIGSQTDATFLKTVLNEFGPFDLIVDDGSHFSADIIYSFNALFAWALKDGGIYLVEDLHANYWPGWRTSRRSFLDVCKEIIEHMHSHYREASSKEFFIAKPSDHRIESIDVPLITTMIHEIRFFDSIVAIYKTKREFAPFAVWTVE
jgi:hypothetical protein